MEQGPRGRSDTLEWSGAIQDTYLDDVINIIDHPPPRRGWRGGAHWVDDIREAPPWNPGSPGLHCDLWRGPEGLALLAGVWGGAESDPRKAGGPSITPWALPLQGLAQSRASSHCLVAGVLTVHI